MKLQPHKWEVVRNPFFLLIPESCPVLTHVPRSSRGGIGIEAILHAVYCAHGTSEMAPLRELMVDFSRVVGRAVFR